LNGSITQNKEKITIKPISVIYKSGVKDKKILKSKNKKFLSSPIFVNKYTTKNPFLKRIEEHYTANLNNLKEMNLSNSKIFPILKKKDSKTNILTNSNKKEIQNFSLSGKTKSIINNKLNDSELNKQKEDNDEKETLDESNIDNITSSYNIIKKTLKRIPTISLRNLKSNKNELKKHLFEQSLIKNKMGNNHNNENNNNNSNELMTIKEIKKNKKKHKEENIQKGKDIMNASIKDELSKKNSDLSRESFFINDKKKLKIIENLPKILK